MDLGTRIKNIRYINGLSQLEMAKKLKINRNYLSRIETNKSLPTSEVLLKIANAFNISIDSLLGLDFDGEKGEDIKLSKIKRIKQFCDHMSNTELDFVINMLYVMANRSKL